MPRQKKDKIQKVTEVLTKLEDAAKSVLINASPDKDNILNNTSILDKSDSLQTAVKKNTKTKVNKNNQKPSKSSTPIKIETEDLKNGKQPQSDDPTYDERATQDLIARQSRVVFNKYNVRSLDELLNENHSPYAYKTEKEYLKYLESLNQYDLDAHAGSLAIMPKDNKDKTINDLIREFQKKTNAYSSGASTNIPIRKPINAEVMKILSEGR